MAARQETHPFPTGPAEDPLWERGPANPALAAGAVHVWRAELYRVPDGWLAALSDEEEARTERFPSPVRGRAWARSRAALRVLLARYAGGDPAAIALRRSPSGRLSLVESPGFSFSLSHSGEVALFAFSDANSVGVDAETGIRLNETALARRLLGPSREQAALALEPGARRSELLRAWVRREALLKCQASGGAPWLLEFDAAPGVPGAVATDAESRPAISFWELG